MDQKYQSEWLGIFDWETNFSILIIVIVEESSKTWNFYYYYSFLIVRKWEIDKEMDRFLRMNAAGMGMGQSNAPTDAPVVDTAEQVYISSLALLKMLKHGRAGKPNKQTLILQNK